MELLDLIKKDESLKQLGFRLDFNEYYNNLKNKEHYEMDLENFVNLI